MSYQQGGYQQGPPAYYGGTQQQTTTVIVGQPTISRVTTVFRSSSDHYLTLSIVMTVLCVFFGGLLPAVLTLVALFLSLSAKEDDLRGDEESARRKGRISLILNITSVALTIAVYIILIIIIVA